MRLRGSSTRRTSSRLVSHFGRFNSTFWWESERSLTLHIAKSGDILCSDPLMLETCPCITCLHKVVTHVPSPCWVVAAPLGLPRWEFWLAKALSRMQSWLAVCWMQSMHIFVIFRIGIMDGWTRKAARSECRQGVARQVKGICSSLNCELFPGRGGLLPAASREYWLLGELTPQPRVSCQICSQALG